MNTKTVISGLMAVCMMASAPAFAQRYDHGGDRNDRNDHVQRSDDGDRYQARGQNERRDWNNRGDRHERNDGYGRNSYSQGNHGYGDYSRRDGYRQQYHRGGYLQSEYRGNRYVVNDWRQRRLSAPPRGYQWVQANNDYVLAAIATGLIAQVLLNN
jgi:Ni/Co efflux regulator RcnB